jgi:hypothetical protein
MMMFSVRFNWNFNDNKNTKMWKSTLALFYFSVTYSKIEKSVYLLSIEYWCPRKLNFRKLSRQMSTYKAAQQLILVLSQNKNMCVCVLLWNYAATSRI